jgi:hypothetical protein
MTREQLNYFQNYNSIQFRNMNSGIALDFFDVDERFTAADLVDRAVNDLSQPYENYLPLRADALTFLYINTDVMILNALTVADRGSKIRQDIVSDLKTIISSASENAIQRRETSISSHEILMAVVRNWNNVRTLKSDSW